MKSKLIMAAVIVGSFALAGCSGGGGNDTAEMMSTDPAPPTEEEERIAELEEDLEDAQEEADEANRLRQAAEADARQAEADRQRLEGEAEARRRADAAADTRRVIVGLNAGNDGELTLVVDLPNLKHGAPAPVTAPTGPFTTTTSRSGQWSKTAHTASTGDMRDMVEVYSDVEAPTSVPFKDSIYNDDNAVVNAEGMVLPGGFELETANRDDVASGSFDRTSALAKSFDMMDRGEHTTAQQRTEAINLAQTALDNDPTNADRREELETARASRVRDTDRHPYRWTAEAGGRLGGASGTFRCGTMNSVADTSCTVQNTGGGFLFVGPWRFVPSSGTVGVRVEDSEHMWFGWWARQTVEHEDPAHPTDDWAFEMGHGGNAATTFIGATGTATYQGQAAGRYAVFEPATGESSHGSFTASARLEANFGTATDWGTVSGTITGFSNDPDWSLALKQADIDPSGGTVGLGSTADADGVTWSIDGVPDDSGQWEAGFYSNLPTGTTGLAQVQPHGIAGTFEAQYDGSGVGPTAAMIGAFGAHR